MNCQHTNDTNSSLNITKTKRRKNTNVELKKFQRKKRAKSLHASSTSLMENDAETNVDECKSVPIGHVSNRCCWEETCQVSAKPNEIEELYVKTSASFDSYKTSPAPEVYSNGRDNSQRLDNDFRFHFLTNGADVDIDTGFKYSTQGIRLSPRLGLQQFEDANIVDEGTYDHPRVEIDAMPRPSCSSSSRPFHSNKSLVASLHECSQTENESSDAACYRCQGHLQGDDSQIDDVHPSTGRVLTDKIENEGTVRVGPHSIQMLSIDRMITYLDIISLESDEYRSVLREIELAKIECSQLHFSGLYGYHHLPGAIFERLVNRLGGQVFLDVYKASKVYKHPRLDEMSEKKALC